MNSIWIAKAQAHNTGLAKVAVQCSADPARAGWLIKVWLSASIPQVRDGENRHLRQARNR